MCWNETIVGQNHGHCTFLSLVSYQNSNPKIFTFSKCKDKINFKLEWSAS